MSTSIAELNQHLDQNPVFIGLEDDVMQSVTVFDSEPLLVYAITPNRENPLLRDLEVKIDTSDLRIQLDAWYWGGWVVGQPQITIDGKVSFQSLHEGKHYRIVLIEQQ